MKPCLYPLIMSLVGPADDPIIVQPVLFLINWGEQKPHRKTAKTAKNRTTAKATSSASWSVTPLDLESQTDENTTPINAAKTIATTCADTDATKKRVAEDDIGSESSNAKKKTVAVKIEKDT
ncbi:hypothetical protein Tco_0930719 [Tanacetum coccineum]